MSLARGSIEKTTGTLARAPEKLNEILFQIDESNLEVPADFFKFSAERFFFILKTNSVIAHLRNMRCVDEEQRPPACRLFQLQTNRGERGG